MNIKIDKLYVLTLDEIERNMLLDILDKVKIPEDTIYTRELNSFITSTKSIIRDK